MPTDDESGKCKWCGGTGTEADYIGLEMKCVEVECSACNGTGTAAERVRSLNAEQRGDG